MGSSQANEIRGRISGWHRYIHLILFDYIFLVAQGRTNKLVDGCYSFWQGGLFPVIAHTLQALGQFGIL